jgi:GTPase SAR1 family protein
VYVVGAQGSGKSSLVSALTNERSAGHRSSDAVTFHWVKRANSNGRLDSASIWELPGTEAFSHAFVNKTKVTASHLTWCMATAVRN